MRGAPPERFNAVHLKQQYFVRGHVNRKNDKAEVILRLSGRDPKAGSGLTYYLAENA
jgi:hypothetical protein